MKKSNDRPLKEVLKEMIEVYRLKSKLHQTKIQSLWTKVMGPAIANYTTEITVRKNKLYLRISSASLRQELTYGRDKIKKMLNEEIGEEFIEEVIIR